MAITFVKWCTEIHDQPHYEYHVCIFHFLVDYGSKDEYGYCVENNGYSERGSEGGFVLTIPNAMK